MTLRGWRPAPRGLEQRLGVEIAEQYESVRAFCRDAGLDDSTLSPYLSGRGLPRLRMARRILTALDCDWGHLWRLRTGMGWPAPQGAVTVRQAKEDAGLSLRTLHRRLASLGHRCSRSRLSEWGRCVHEPSLPTVLYLAAALQRHPDDLFPADSA